MQELIYPLDLALKRDLTGGIFLRKENGKISGTLYDGSYEKNKRNIENILAQTNELTFLRTINNLAEEYAKQKGYNYERLKIDEEENLSIWILKGATLDFYKFPNDNKPIGVDTFGGGCSIMNNSYKDFQDAIKGIIKKIIEESPQSFTRYG